MSSIAVLAAGGVLVIAAMIGLADAFVHLACWGARGLRRQDPRL